MAGKCDIAYLQKLQTPFLLHMKISTEENIVMARWNTSSNDLSIYSPKNNSWVTKGISETSKVWDGVIIYTEQKPKRTVNLQYAWKSLIGIIMTILLESFITAYWGYMIGIELSLIIIGLLLSTYMLARDHGYKNSILDKLCYISSSADCNSVSASKYGNIAGYRMSELATSFFISQLAISLIMLAEHDTISIVTGSATTIIAPVLIYSVYSQIIIKRFCPYCIALLTVLLVQTVLSLAYIEISQSMYTFLMIGVLTLLLATLAKIARIRQDKKSIYKEWLYESLSLKRKRYILLNESSKLNIANGNGFLWVENEEVEDIITTIISPSCRNCKNMVLNIFQLLNDGIVPFKWRIILGESHIGDAKLNEDWIRCYMSDRQLFLRNLRKWCKIKKEHKFYALTSQLANSEEKISKICENFKSTIESCKITGFPRIAINNMLLSSVYNGSDIRYIIIDKEIKE